ncbi:DEAD-box ATP-dependent RNA helicase 10 isoform X1 [Medicago truncatula]|uniref:DEAD-box ATP-dependent RNA helicase n=2 Tax=Medicago truncatula TaxID=3880 RepID=G7KE08_MEDTR|nr:DEAD-box ATP-dependent RNA helicase 10 isoform X1 [Medicago truncatula]XP_024640397.1 DEAD-box ATP-dependent RNA helicase 10 isoform X1 [Medicago truncatula]AES98499.2 DEAD-box ATP-dependent RNA helicase [Medicago truncatula]
MSEEMKSFTDLGLSVQLVEACEKMRWYSPLKIQTEVIPLALQGKDDVIGISPPRSGKAGAFVLPILQALLEAGPNLNTSFACVLSPSRDLVFRIAEYFQVLGSQFGVKCATLVEANDIIDQTNQILQQPHLIVGTLRQVFYHLRLTQGFSLARLKYLVIHEADLLLNDQFEEQQLNDILSIIPSERRTFLFSSTMTEKVHMIQRLSLRNPLKIDVSSKYSTVVTQLQQSCFMPAMLKDCYLVYILTEMTGRKSTVFTQTCGSAFLLALILKNLDFRAIPIISYMSQAKKLGALNAFKSGKFNILLCSEAARRGLDIPAVDMVINYNIPRDPNDYMHRVGWTGHVNAAISFVNPYEAGQLEMIERHTGKKLPVYPAPCENVLLWRGTVREAERLARKEIKESGWKSGGYLGDEEVKKISSLR